MKQTILFFTKHMGILSIQVRESWTDDEHARFLAALAIHGRNWIEVQRMVGSNKPLGAVRSHAQKYFARLEKKGQLASVPPPRPKKKSQSPYPLASSVKRPRLQREMHPVSSDATSSAFHAPRVVSSADIASGGLESEPNFSSIYQYLAGYLGFRCVSSIAERPW